MSVNYGGPPSGGTAYGGGYAPPGRVNFGWLQEAFELFQANIGVWILAVLAVFVVPAVIGGIIGAALGAGSALSGGGGQPTFGSSPFGFHSSPLTGGLSPGVSALIRIADALYTAFLYGGIYQMAVKQVRGESISPADIFSGGPYFLKMLGFNIIFGIAFVVGTLLLIVPGLLVVALMLPAYALIAEGESVSNAISRSVDAMKRDMWSAVGFVIVMGLVALLSALPCGLGLFVTYPMVWLVSALAYRDMIGMPGAVSTTGAYGVPPGYGAAQSGVWPPPPEARPPAFGQPPSSDPASFSPPRRSLSGEDLDAPEQPPTPPPAA